MDELSAWDLYFLQIAGWMFHPGYKRRRDDVDNTLLDCADIADRMIQIRGQRWQPDSQQQQAH